MLILSPTSEKIPNTTRKDWKSSELCMLSCSAGYALLLPHLGLFPLYEFTPPLSSWVHKGALYFILK